MPAPLESTPRKNAADPTAVLDGNSVVMEGVGSGVVEGATVKAEDADDNAGIVALETVIVAGPGNAVSIAEIVAVSCVALT
jgi:hypothetical protein